MGLVDARDPRRAPGAHDALRRRALRPGLPRSRPGRARRPRRRRLVGDRLDGRIPPRRRGRAGGDVVLKGRTRPDAFVDSVALMQVTERVRALAGVRDAALVMATDRNRRLLADAGLLPAEARKAGPNDLVIAVWAESAETADQALGHAEGWLAARRGDEGPHRLEPPRSIAGAARRVSGASIALISVPGPHAAAEAHQALSAGLHVFLFSDGVPLADEVRLKQRAQARGLLVMGPECGTSILDGIGLGFANRVRRGPVGLVAASGTGLQEVTSLIHRLGGG